MKRRLHKNSAIGVFDSGIGGLTVARSIRLLLPEERMVYFGDLLHLPYGSKSEHAVVQFSMAACGFLRSLNIKLLVVACNTAASLAMERIVREVDVPVVGVIEPGAKRACAVTKNRRVGIIGTPRTIESGSYTAALKKIDPTVEVYQKSTPLLVPMIEEGWIGHPALMMVLDEYLSYFKEKAIDTIVLGCTHYPLIRGEVKESLQGVEMAQVVDSAETTAEETKIVLDEMKMHRAPESDDRLTVYLTDVTTGFRAVAGRILGCENIDIEIVSSDYAAGRLQYSV
jgi:glutamate racemase